MDAEVKKIWVDALRSGKYHQGKSVLKREWLQKDGSKTFTHCCLGVIAEEMKVPSVMEDGRFHEYLFTFAPGQSNSAYLTTSFRGKIGLCSADEQTLIKMNDGGKTFCEIADYIDQNL